MLVQKNYATCLDIPEQQAGEIIKTILGRQYGALGKKDGPAIVEESKDENGMKSFAERQEEDDPVWDSGRRLVNGTRQGQGSHIESAIDVLCQRHVLASVCHGV